MNLGRYQSILRRSHSEAQSSTRKRQTLGNGRGKSLVEAVETIANLLHEPLKPKTKIVDKTKKPKKCILSLNLTLFCLDFFLLEYLYIRINTDTWRSGCRAMKQPYHFKTSHQVDGSAFQMTEWDSFTLTSPVSQFALRLTHFLLKEFPLPLTALLSGMSCRRTRERGGIF